MSTHPALRNATVQSRTMQYNVRNSAKPTHLSMTGVTYQNCILGCEGLWQASNVGCWMESCWNQVYSCEYQMTAMSYFDGTDLVQNSNVPFYPAPQGPEGGPGACCEFGVLESEEGTCLRCIIACNLGYVYGNITAISQNLICTTVAGSGDLNAVYTCECCEFSWGASKHVLPHTPKPL